MAKRSLNIGKKVFLVHGKRTPFGKFGGSLKNVSPVDLAVHAAKSALEDCQISPKKLDHVIFGNVIPSTTDTLYGARHLALKLGALEETAAYNVNRLCGSGLQAILDAVNLIKLDQADCVLASGSENMSMTPHLVYGSRFGTRYGPLETVDMLMDTLTDKFIGTAMALTAEKLADMRGISRNDCDEYSLNSHKKASLAYQNKRFQGEIAPFEVGKMLCDKDEHVRLDASLENLASLKPSFKDEGVVTAGTASGIVDGACAVLLASEDFVKREGLKPLAEILDGSVVGVDPKLMGIGPVPAVGELLRRNDMKISSIDAFEINEAFAAQALACSRELKLNPAALNRWGGAVAIGHPLAATGTRITLTLARQLKEDDLEYGVASACIGGGQGMSLLLKRA